MERNVGGDVHDLLDMGKERRGRLQQVICFRVGSKIGGLYLEERRERQRSVVSLPASWPNSRHFSTL